LLQVAEVGALAVPAKPTIKLQEAKAVALLAKLEQAPHLPEPVVAAARKQQAVTAALHGAAANPVLPEP
jgi:hypothetical protein